MTLNPWVFALVQVGAGLLLGEMAGRALRANLSRPGRPPETRRLARLAGTIAFWSITAVGLLLATATMSPESLEEVAQRIEDVLPDLLVAGVFLIAGSAVSIAVAATVGQSVLRATGVRQRGLERLLRLTVIAASLVLALSQIGVDASILVLVTAALLGAPALGAALLTGLGGRAVAANLAAGRALRSQIQVDQWIRCTGVDGTSVSGIVVALHPVTVEVLTDDGVSVHIPLSCLIEAPFEVRVARSWMP